MVQTCSDQRRLLQPRHVQAQFRPCEIEMSRPPVFQRLPGAAQAPVVQTRLGAHSPFVQTSPGAAQAPVVYTRPGGSKSPCNLDSSSGAAQAPIVQTCPDQHRFLLSGHAQVQASVLMTSLGAAHASVVKARPGACSYMSLVQVQLGPCDEDTSRSSTGSCCTGKYYKQCSSDPVVQTPPGAAKASLSLQYNKQLLYF